MRLNGYSALFALGFLAERFQALPDVRGVNRSSFPPTRQHRTLFRIRSGEENTEDAE